MKYKYPRYYYREDDFCGYVIYKVVSKNTTPKLVDKDGNCINCCFREDSLLRLISGKNPMYRIIKKEELALII